MNETRNLPLQEGANLPLQRTPWEDTNPFIQARFNKFPLNVPAEQVVLGLCGSDKDECRDREAKSDYNVVWSQLHCIQRRGQGRITHIHAYDIQLTCSVKMSG